MIRMYTYNRWSLCSGGTVLREGDRWVICDTIWITKRSLRQIETDPGEISLFQILSLFSDKDRRTDSWIRRKKNTAQPCRGIERRALPQLSGLLSLSEKRERIWSGMIPTRASFWNKSLLSRRQTHVLWNACSPSCRMLVAAMQPPYRCGQVRWLLLSCHKAQYPWTVMNKERHWEIFEAHRSPVRDGSSIDQ